MLDFLQHCVFLANLSCGQGSGNSAPLTLLRRINHVSFETWISLSKIDDVALVSLYYTLDNRETPIVV